jgi:hypothetical protein
LGVATYRSLPLFSLLRGLSASAAWLAYAKAVRIVCVFIVRRRTPSASSVATTTGSFFC